MSIFRRRSYTETIEGRKRFLARAKLFALVFLAFEFVSGGFLVALSVTSASMNPTLKAGDRLLASPLPYGPLTPFGKLPAISRPERGDLVLVDPPFGSRPGFFFSVADSLLRFVTLQKLSLRGAELGQSILGPFVERVIAVPGDEVSMEGYVFKVRTAGSLHALTEFEFSSNRYDVHRPGLPTGWSTSDPLSGSMAPRILAKDEYFVASDNRGSTADSRAWGPVAPADFRARLIFRYWPFSGFGGF